LKLNVFFLPSSIVHTPENAHDVYIVIDLIRATSCMTVMLDGGVQQIFAASSVEQARAARELYPERLLCGERHGKTLPGFDYGNSPVEFSRADLQGRDLIMTTTNGTRAFHACPLEAVRLGGSLLNAQAVVRRALAFAEARQVDLHIVCAGEEDYFGLDDAVCAGYLAQELQREALALELDESAQTAITLYEIYPPSRLVEYSDAARAVFESGLTDDPSFCVQTSISQGVALVVGLEEETGLLILENAAHAIPA
jgi:2-phosphosulfolactate phosphatase